MSSTFYPGRRAHGGPARRWLVGGGAVLTGGAALVSIVVAQPRAAPQVALPAVVAPPAPTNPPIEVYTVEGPPSDEWRVKDAMDGYAIVDGLVMVRVSSGDSASAASRLVALDDGYYDEGPQGYYWRLRPGR